MAYRANVLGEPFVELFLEKLAASELEKCRLKSSVTRPMCWASTRRSCLRKLCESSDSMC